MSTILKALQRLEDEKRPSAELSLDEQIAITPSVDSSNPRSWVVMVLCGVIGILGTMTVIGWLSLTSETAVEPPPVAAAAPMQATPKRAQVSQSTPEVASAPAVAASVAPPQTSSRASSQSSSGVEVVRWIESKPKPVTALASPPDSIDHPQDSGARDRALAFRDGLSDSVAFEQAEARADGLAKLTISSHEASTNRPGSTPATDVVASAQSSSSRPEIQSTPAANSSSPILPRRANPAPPPRTAKEPTQPILPQVASAKAEKTPAATQSSHKSSVRPATADHKVVLRAAIPKLKVRSTVWHPQRDRRVAVIELGSGEVLKLNEGDAIGPLVVESIKLSGVYFIHDGVSVLHSVGR